MQDNCSTLYKRTPQHVVILLAGILIFIWSASANNCQYDVTDYRIVRSVNNALIQAMTHDKLNIVILLDVSASIGSSLFHEEVSTFALEFINYGVRHAGLKIHPDHAHLELITFDDTVDILNYNRDGYHVHACEIHDKMEAITRRTSFTGSTHIHEALNASRYVFLKDQRVAEKKVLFVVTDGDFTSRIDQVAVSIGALRTVPVEVFAVGVGNRVRDGVEKVADDLNHILCYKTWKALLDAQGDTRGSNNTWADVTEQQATDHCPKCGSSSNCQCAVNLQQYRCRCETGHFVNANGNCEVCTGSCKPDQRNCLAVCEHANTVTHPSTSEVAPGIEDTAAGLDTNMLILALVVTLALFVLLLAIIVALARWRSHVNKDEGSPKGVQSFVNFIFSGISVKLKQIVSSKKDNGNPYVIDTSRPSSLDVRDFTPVEIDPGRLFHLTQVFSGSQNSRIDTMFNTNTFQHGGHERRTPFQGTRTTGVQTRMPSTPHNPTRHTSTSYLSVRNSTETEGYEIPESYEQPSNNYEPCSHQENSTNHSYENLSNRSEELHAHLTKMVDSSDLNALGVFCKLDNSLSSTENFALRQSDVSHVKRLLAACPDRAVFPMNGRMHEVKIYHPGHSLYAEEIPRSSEDVAVWVLDTEHFLLVALGVRTLALDCEHMLNNLALDLTI